MIQPHNTFLTSLSIGDVQFFRIIFAIDQNDVINTISDYYVDYKINYILSYYDISLLLEEALKNTSLQFYMVVELKSNYKEELEYDTYFERVSDINELKEKYKNNICFFYNKDFILNLASISEKELEKPTYTILMSDKIEL